MRDLGKRKISRRDAGFAKILARDAALRKKKVFGTEITAVRDGRRERKEGEFGIRPPPPSTSFQNLFISTVSRTSSAGLLPLDPIY